MKKMKFILTGCMLAATLFYSCEKEDNSGKSATCSDISDDAIIMDGVSYVFQPLQATNCAESNINGATWFTHFRSVHDGTQHTPGVSFNQPDINITLSNAPQPGTTTTYTLSDGSWQISSSPAPVGLATFRMANYFDAANQQIQSWFSDAQSGTIEVTVDASGIISMSFSEVKLLRNGGLLTERKTLCGKNIICH